MPLDMWCSREAHRPGTIHHRHTLDTRANRLDTRRSRFVLQTEHATSLSGNRLARDDNHSDEIMASTVHTYHQARPPASWLTTHKGVKYEGLGSNEDDE